MDERAAVGAGLDFVLGNVREGDAGDPLVALRQGVTVAVDKELKRLHEADCVKTLGGEGFRAAHGDVRIRHETHSWH